MAPRSRRAGRPDQQLFQQLDRPRARHVAPRVKQTPLSVACGRCGLGTRPLIRVSLAGWDLTGLHRKKAPTRTRGILRLCRFAPRPVRAFALTIAVTLAGASFPTVRAMPSVSELDAEPTALPTIPCGIQAHRSARANTIRPSGMSGFCGVWDGYAHWRRILWRATADDDEHYAFAIAL